MTLSELLSIIQHLFDPIAFLLVATLYLPGTILSLIHKRDFQTLLKFSSFKDAWFARFWAVYGPTSREGATPDARPFIALAHGTILEIGPGAGEWVHLYDKTKVTKIYGVEPNRDHLAGLRRKIVDAGLEEVYEVVPVGVEDLGDRWVKRGSVDCVVTIQCLCSIPTPKHMIAELYTYLKEGGQWIVYEHVVTHSGGWVARYQSSIDIIWPIFLGGCSITRDSEKWLRETGSWSDVNLTQPTDEPYYKIIPHVMGVLTK